VNGSIVLTEISYRNIFERNKFPRVMRYTFFCHLFAAQKMTFTTLTPPLVVANKNCCVRCWHCPRLFAQVTVITYNFELSFCVKFNIV